ncbi:MAG: hypothetical protein HY553_21900 [Elusimicrobia bacterium]|nr:hypothetical protein [Elusimicrobiota bacterium]
MIAALLAALALGAGAQPAVTVSTAAAAPKSRLEAAPNPCTVPAGKQFCRARLDWTAATSSATAHVTFSANRGPERPLACGLRGRQEVGWIVPGNRYVFTLYGAGACDEAFRGEALAAVTVTGRREPAAGYGSSSGASPEPKKRRKSRQKSP